VHSLQLSDKIAALKDTNLNPHLLAEASPYDALANSMHRWTTLASKAQHLTPEQQVKVASSYYDKEIAPYYNKLKVDAMPKKAWMDQAYKEAAHLDIAKHFYGENGGSVKKGFFNGLESASEQVDEVGKFATNMLGMMVHTGRDLLKASETYSGANTVSPQAKMAWHNSMLQMQAVETKKYGGKGFFDTVEAITHDMPILGKVQDFWNKEASENRFWDHIDPSKGFTEHATSMTVETVATLPMFGALGKVTKVIGVASKAVPQIENLTNVLSKIPGGKAIMGALTAGGEGLAYGKLTRPNEDKDKAWQDGLSFAVLHTGFHISGKIAGKVADRSIHTLGSMVDKYGTQGMKDKLAEHADNLKTMVEENRRPATAAERYEAHVGEAANNISVVGVVGQKAIIQQAIDHIIEHEKGATSRAALKDIEAKMLQDDVASASPMLSAAKYIKSLLGDRKLSKLKPNSKDLAFIKDRVSKLLIDASNGVDQHSNLVQNVTKRNASKIAEGPSAQKQIQRLFLKAKAEVQQMGIKNADGSPLSDEKIMEKAKQDYVDAAAKGAARAEKARGTKPSKEVEAIARKRVDTAVPGDSYGDRTRFTVNKKGEPAVSYNVNQNYLTYLKSKAPSLKSGELTKFFEDMAPEDFKQDLEDHFYPQDLKDAGIWFEHDTTKEGNHNPNFLAFMYNYKDQMPKELGDELGRRIQDTPKFEKFFKKGQDVESQMRFYALQMYNHMDDFLSSGRWPKETNVFRSTQSDLLNPTIYQKQLLEEREVQEQKQIKTMFKKHPEAMEAALASWQITSKERATQFAMSPTFKRAIKIREASDNISADIVEKSNGMYIPWKF
jgi:hypothetical protein